jgi:hypothetical protein
VGGLGSKRRPGPFHLEPAQVSGKTTAQSSRPGHAVSARRARTAGAAESDGPLCATRTSKPSNGDAVAVILRGRIWGRRVRTGFSGLWGCKIGKVRCEHIESLYPRSRPMRGHPSTVSSFQFGKYRTKSSSTSGHPAVGVAFHSRVQATAEVPSRLNDQQTCYRPASQFSRVIFAIVCVEHRERQP